MIIIYISAQDLNAELDYKNRCLTEMFCNSVIMEKELKDIFIFSYVHKILKYQFPAQVMYFVNTKQEP